MPDSVTFDHYEVLTRDDGSLFELGRGAMGITYKAFDTNLRIPVALKVINATYLDSDVARQRFIREARSAAKLRHRHVASVFHLGTEAGAYFYAMEFIDGETVDALIKRQGPLSPALSLQIADQVARAFNAAQPHGLVHRDIKPANLMLVHEDDDVVVKVIDFGLAKSSIGGDEDSATLSIGGFVGTPHFASPEQLEEKEIDVRSDIYSLGVTLWYMLAGQTPFAGSMAQVMSQHLSKPPPFEKIDRLPPKVAGLLRRMLEKDPADRPQTPTALRREVEEALQSLGGSAPLADTATVTEPQDFATLLDDSSLRVGETHFEAGAVIGERYRIIENLGDSNTGRNFRAEQLGSCLPVRLLVLHRDLVSNGTAYGQIEREVEKVAPIAHPNLLKVYSLETTGDSSFLVLEAMEGFTLLELLRARRELRSEEVLKLLVQAAEGIDHALEAGLKRLDLALHQVSVSFDHGIVSKETLLREAVENWPAFTLKLNPLGITREVSLSETWAGGQTMVGNAAPRNDESADVRTRTLQALGAICYELLGGTLSPLALTGAGSFRYTPLATLSEEGNNVVRRALDPTLSFPKAQDFYRALLELHGAHTARHEIKAPASVTSRPATVTSRPATVVPPVAPPRRPKQKFPIAFFSGLATVAAIASIIYFLSKENSAGPSGNPSATPEVTTEPSGDTEETPPPTPTEEPMLVETLEPEQPPPGPSRQDLLKTALTEAETLEAAEKWPEALRAYLKINKDYPDFQSGKVQLEILIERLRTRRPEINAKELAGLREPVTEAAELNVLAAMTFLGENLRREAPEMAFKWFSAAAERGQLTAITQVGLMHSNGTGCPVDLGKAVEFFQLAADKGHGPAKTALAECYLVGKSVPKDPKRGVELLQEAVDLGDARAMDLLGTCYHDGVGVAKNFAEAFRLYTQAADLGYMISLGNLGVLYVNGDGVKRSPQKAVEIFIRGVTGGDATCMYFYAQCFETGTGVPANRLLAQTWYKKAAEAGNPRAAAWCRKEGIPFTPK